MNNFGARLKRCRETIGLTQRELGEKANMSPQKISNLERGYTAGLNANDIALLSTILNTSSEYLIKGVETGIAKTPNVPNELNGVLVAFDRGEFEDLTQDEVEALAVIAKTLKVQRRL